MDIEKTPDRVPGYYVASRTLELPELKEMTRLLASYSNNLNQIAKRVNSMGNIYAADIEEVQHQMDDLWAASEKIIRILSKIK